MPLRYTIEGLVLVFEFEGGTPAHDVYTVFHRAFADPACPRDARLLVDLSRSTSLSSRAPETVKSLTEYVLQHPNRPGNRMAVVLPEPEIARLEPWLEAVRPGAPAHVRIFGDRASAGSWLAGKAQADSQD